MIRQRDWRADWISETQRIHRLLAEQATANKLQAAEARAGGGGGGGGGGGNRHHPNNNNDMDEEEEQDAVHNYLQNPNADVPADLLHHLPAAIGWPVVSMVRRNRSGGSDQSDGDDDDADGGHGAGDEAGAIMVLDVTDTGLPMLSVIMEVNIMGLYKFEASLAAFQANFGDLPAGVVFALTKALYKTNQFTSKNVDHGGGGGAQGGEASAAEEQLPEEIFLGAVVQISEKQRWEKFKPGKGTLKGFYSAGCLSHQYQHFMKIMMNTSRTAVQKAYLFNEYMQCAGPQFKAIALNNSLRSKHTTHVVGHIDSVDAKVCTDLQELLRSIFTDCDQDNISSNLEDQPWSHNVSSLTYWDVMNTSPFVRTTWVMSEMRKKYNEKYYSLSAANMRICADTWLSSIAFRLGQNNGFTYIGLPTVVMDGAGKLKCRMPGNHYLTPDTTKRPSAGLDLDREVLDSERSSHLPYLSQSMSSTDDGSLITQLKRTTPGGIQTGFVSIVGEDIESQPTDELAQDTMMPGFLLFCCCCTIMDSARCFVG